MNVGELKKMLDAYPDDMDVVIDKYSDYSIVCEAEIIKGVDNGSFVMASHPSMSEANKEKEKEFLLLVPK